MSWPIILDLTIIFLLVVDIILYHRMYNIVKHLAIVSGYTYNYLSDKDKDF
jgi:hypothetical protein